MTTRKTPVKMKKESQKVETKRNLTESLNLKGLREAKIGGNNIILNWREIKIAAPEDLQIKLGGEDQITKIIKKQKPSSDIQRPFDTATSNFI